MVAFLHREGLHFNAVFVAHTERKVVANYMQSWNRFNTDAMVMGKWSFGISVLSILFSGVPNNFE
jgi:hypothetical protein